MNQAKPVKKKKRNLLLRIALLIFAVYVMVTLIQLQLEISAKQSGDKGIDELSSEIAELQRQNEDLQNKLDHPDRYLEEQAREQGYVHPGDDVYKEIP